MSYNAGQWAADHLPALTVLGWDGQPHGAHDWDDDGCCRRPGCKRVHFLDATGPCPGAPS
jgi:hypothetical protein